MTVSRQALLAHCDALLQPANFKDYGPNGLQVEGKAEIGKIVSGVTASLALIDAAIEAKADAIFVHHGLFWRGQDGRVVGWMKQRLAKLLAHDINLYAYHLPLDAHPELGNNAQLGKLLGFGALPPPAIQRFGDYNLGWLGQPQPAHQHAAKLAQHVEKTLGRKVQLITAPEHLQREIKTVAWCTGGAQDWFEAAIDAGADAFITGELSEPQTHLARECGVAFLACGHHATERYGAPAAAAHLAAQLGLEHEFVDIANPA
jgi:dinuclear metal center YbgI/SA1388 family protein